MISTPTIRTKMSEASCRILLTHPFVFFVAFVVKYKNQKDMFLEKNQRGFNERVFLQKDLELSESIF
jgi:hypothetical protein